LRTKQTLLETQYGNLHFFNYRPEFSFLELNQVHQKKIISTKDCLLLENNIKADGFFATQEELNITAFAIKTADCLPVLILGQKGIALIHSGWRGLQKNIFSQKIVRKIIPTEAYLGPSICIKCYKVSSEFIEYFKNSTSFQDINHSIHFDLKKEARAQLIREYSSIQINESSICTCCNKNFHSYRRNRTSERNYTIFIPKSSKVSL